MNRLVFLKDATEAGAGGILIEHENPKYPVEEADILGVVLLGFAPYPSWWNNTNKGYLGVRIALLRKNWYLLKVHAL